MLSNRLFGFPACAILSIERGGHMLNIPTINEHGRVFKSQFYYVAYQEAGIPEATANRVMCLSHYHKEPMSQNEYQEISLSKTLLDYPDWGDVNMSCILPVSREEYTIRGRILQNELDVDLKWFPKLLISPPTTQNILWTITFGFLISMLVGIYAFDMFYAGFTASVALSLTIMLTVCAVMTLGVSLIRIYFAIKFVHSYLVERDHRLDVVGHICWAAFDNGHLSTERFLETVDSLDGDDEIALFVEAELYTAKFIGASPDNSPYIEKTNENINM